MKAAIYARVSTDMQVDSYSISAQVSEVQTYSKNQGIEIHKIYIDEGESGTKENRPQFQQMIKDAEQKLFSVILVHKFDRFARSVEISSKIKTRLRKAGVNVISITEPVEDSPIGFFQEGLMALLAEYFSKNLAKEVKKGQKERVSKGLPAGRAPYGYRHENKTIVVDEEQANIVRLVFELFVIEGMGFEKIAIRLNQLRVKPPQSELWHHWHIQRIIDHRIYIGELIYNGKHYPSAIPTIIDKQLFESAQKIREPMIKRMTYKSSNKDKFLFAGLLFCAECGSAIAMNKTKSKNKDCWFYFCPHARRDRIVRKCTQRKYIKAARLEDKILQHITNILKSKTVNIEAPTKETIIPIADRKEKILQELERAKVAYIRSVFSLDEFTEIKTRLENELKLVESEDIKPKTQKVNIKPHIKTMLQELKSIPEDEILKRKAVLQKYIDRINYTPKELNIIWHI